MNSSYLALRPFDPIPDLWGNGPWPGDPDWPAYCEQYRKANERHRKRRIAQRKRRVVLKAGIRAGTASRQ